MIVGEIIVRIMTIGAIIVRATTGRATLLGEMICANYRRSNNQSEQESIGAIIGLMIV